MEDAKYLYFLDLNRLCRLNLTEFELNKDDPPSFEIVFNFHEANLPAGMGLFTLDDNDSGSAPTVYVVGGEKTRVRPESCYPWNYFLWRSGTDMREFLDESYGDEGMGRQVYRLEPNSSSSSSNKNKTTGKNAQKIIAVESSTIPHMISPKPNALTAKIDGKVYVMANRPYFDTRRCQIPTFEVYDPVENSWEALEDCPFHPRTFVPNALFVLNHLLIVHYMQHFHIYDVDERVWLDGNTDLIQRQFSCFSSFKDRVPPPYLSGKVATYEDVTVAYTGSPSHGVVVYFPSHNVGPKHQSLDGLVFPFEIDDESPFDYDCSYDRHFNDFRVGNVFHLGGGKMCFFCTVCDHTHAMVIIFQLKLQRSGMHYCSASADILRSHSYHLHEPLGDFGLIREPFVMGELFDIRKPQDDVRNASSKRQRVLQLEALDVDASSERLQTNSHRSPQMTDSAMNDNLATTQAFGTNPVVAGSQL